MEDFLERRRPSGVQLLFTCSVERHCPLFLRSIFRRMMVMLFRCSAMAKKRTSNQNTRLRAVLISIRPNQLNVIKWSSTLWSCSSECPTRRLIGTAAAAGRLYMCSTCPILFISRGDLSYGLLHNDAMTIPHQMLTKGVEECEWIMIGIFLFVSWTNGVSLDSSIYLLQAAGPPVQNEPVDLSVRSVAPAAEAAAQVGKLIDRKTDIIDM